MMSAEREPITVVWGRAASKVQGQSSWSGDYGEAFLSICLFVWDERAL